MKQSLNNQQVQELLSSLADGEQAEDSSFAQDAALEMALTDRDARSMWQATHITRDVLQADYHTSIDSDFANRVSALIDQEADIDNVVNINSARHSGAVSSTAAKSATSNSLWQPIAGLALAASIVGAGLIFIPAWQSEQPDDSAQIASTDNADTTAPAIATVAATVPEASELQVAGTRWRMESEVPRNEEVEERLNALLTNHLEDASMGVPVRGMLSHSRVVSYDSTPVKE